MAEKVKVFGSALDVLDGTEKIEIKRAYMSAVSAGRIFHPNFLDPYDAISALDSKLFGKYCEKVGKIPVETWLTPKPHWEDFSMVTPENYKSFLEDNGCQKYSKLTGDFLHDILPHPFIMIGVDHSQTGGVLRKLAQHYGPDQISVIILDAHFDIFDFDLLYNVQRGSIGREGNWRPDSLYNYNFYGCGNFLKYMLQDKVILPENLYVIGVTDFPNKIVSDEDNQEVKRFIDTYHSFIKSGPKIVTKADVESGGEKVLKVLSEIKTPYVYVSVDLDVGAISATNAVRFLNTVGLKEELIYRTINTIRDVVERGKLRCLGFDLMEIDVHFAGYVNKEGVWDRSYDMAANIMRNLLHTLFQTD